MFASGPLKLSMAWSFFPRGGHNMGGGGRIPQCVGIGHSPPPGCSDHLTSEVRVSCRFPVSFRTDSRKQPASFSLGRSHCLAAELQGLLSRQRPIPAIPSAATLPSRRRQISKEQQNFGLPFPSCKLGVPAGGGGMGCSEKSDGNADQRQDRPSTLGEEMRSPPRTKMSLFLT